MAQRIFRETSLFQITKTFSLETTLTIISKQSFSLIENRRTLRERKKTVVLLKLKSPHPIGPTL